MPRSGQLGWFAQGALMAIGGVILGSIAVQRLPFGSLVDFVYWACVVALIFLYGQASATAAYYNFREGPDAAAFKTDQDQDSEGRRRASAAFEKGAKRGLFVVLPASLVAWLLAHLLF